MDKNTVNATDRDTFVELIQGLMPSITDAQGRGADKNALYGTIMEHVSHYDEDLREDLALRAMLFAVMLVDHEDKLWSSELVHRDDKTMVLGTGLIWSLCNLPVDKTADSETLTIVCPVDVIVRTAKHYETMERLEEFSSSSVH